MHNHYLRTIDENIITYGFSDAFETPLESDVLFRESSERHFHLLITQPLINERGQFCLKLIDGEIIERSELELDNEWNNREFPLSPVELLQSENALLTLEMINTQIRLEQVEQEQASLLLTLVGNGVI